MLIINSVLDFAKRHNSNLSFHIGRSKKTGELCLYATCMDCKQENRYVISD